AGLAVLPVARHDESVVVVRIPCQGLAEVARCLPDLLRDLVPGLLELGAAAFLHLHVETCANHGDRREPNPYAGLPQESFTGPRSRFRIARPGTRRTPPQRRRLTCSAALPTFRPQRERSRRASTSGTRTSSRSRSPARASWAASRWSTSTPARP